MSSDRDRTDPVAGLDRAFTALRERAPEPHFAPAVAVRRRARRRTHARIALAAIVVVGLLVGGALVARTGDGGPVEPAASPAVSLPAEPTDYHGIPGRFLLRPAELPPTFWMKETPERDAAGTFPIHIACVDSTVVFASAEHRQAQRSVTFYHEEDRALMSGDTPDRGGGLLLQQVTQSVTVFEPGWAARGIAEYRAWIDTCPGRAGMTYTVVHSDFAGDESVVYRVQQTPGTDYFLVVVRVGDRVAVLSITKRFSADIARDLGQKAARHLGS